MSYNVAVCDVMMAEKSHLGVNRRIKVIIGNPPV